MKIFAYFLSAIFLIIPNQSRADDDGSIATFTRKISSIYSISKSCEKALYPGPKEYMSQIEDYLGKLYPNGAGYWVIPKNVQEITNTQTCITLMQGQLLGYQKELEAFQSNNPSRESPPILTVYNWNSKYVPETLEQAMKDLREQEKNKAPKIASAAMQKFSK